MLQFLALGLSLSATVLSSLGALYYRYYQDFYDLAIASSAQTDNNTWTRQLMDIHDKALRPLVRFAILPSVASSIVFMLCYWMDQRPWNRFQKLFYTVFNAPVVWIIATSLFITFKLTMHASETGDF
jgi:hypothetical protein